MLDLEIVTRPAAQDWRVIVDRDELKLHMRLLSTKLDPEIEQAIKSAIEGYDGPAGTLNRSLLPYAYKRYLAEWPESGLIRLPYPPLRTVSAITYRDVNEAPQTLSSSTYIVHNDQEGPAEIEFLDVDSLPGTDEHPRAVTVAFTAGYGIDTGQVPPPAHLKRLVKLLAAHFMENPEATINEVKVVTINRKIDFGVDHLEAKLKVPHEYGDWT